MFTRGLFLACVLLIGTANAQTIPSSFWGMNYSIPTLIAQPKIFAGNVRVWPSTNGVISTQWSSMETCRPANVTNQNDPCYNWTGMDALVAWAKGATVTYAFGNVPGWANGNAGQGVPPTSFTDFYNFVTTLATRYAGKGVIYEGWNEFSPGSGYWTGTIAQMVTLFSQACSIIHATDPSALVGTPTSTNYTGIAAMDAFLAAGGGACADINMVHGYAINQSTGPGVPYQPPEQAWQIVQTYKGMFSYYGLGSKPFAVTEGYWGGCGCITTTTQQTAWGLVYVSLLASGGISFQDWYDYDATNGDGTLFDGAAWLNATGQGYRAMVSWLSGATFSSPIARIATTNQIRNPSGSGAAAGTQGPCASTTPGTLPTNWSIFPATGTNGIHLSVVGTGTENGVAYTDIRICGTPVTNGGESIYFEAGNHITASNGQLWNPCVYVKLAGGSATNVSLSLQYQENNSSFSFIDNPVNFAFNPFPYPLQTQPQCYSGVNISGSVAFVLPYIGLAATAGNAFDITLRIGAPTMDNGSQWSGTTDKGQIVWDANASSSFSTALGFTWTADGQQTAVSGGNVTLTNTPQMLESSVQKGWTP